MPIVTCTKTLKARIATFVNKVEISTLDTIFECHRFFARYFSKVAAAAAVLHASSDSSSAATF